LAYREDHYLGANIGAKSTMDRFDPLLVCLHDSVLNYKTHEDNTDAKSFEGLVNSVAALLNANLTPTEKILTADVLISLVKQAERDLRVSLSERLAVRDDLPETLLHHLAYGDIDIAEPVLKYSPLLNDHDLIYVVHSKGAEHWRAIAKREHISDKLISVLVGKQDVATSMGLLSNTTIDLTNDCLAGMLPLATEHKDFSEAYVQYSTLPSELAVSIYWHVSVALRTSIAKKFKVNDDVLDKALEDCVQDFTDTVLFVDSRPSSLMVEVSECYAQKNKISEKFMIDVLRRRQGRFFMAMFAKQTGLSHTVVSEVMRQKGGQGMAVACRAINISKEGFISLFLLARAISTAVDPVVGAELKMAIRYYDGLTHKMANDILTNSIAK